MVDTRTAEIEQSPVVVQGGSGEGNSQVNEINANSAEDCIVKQRPIAEQGSVVSNLRSTAGQEGGAESKVT